MSLKSGVEKRCVDGFGKGQETPHRQMTEDDTPLGYIYKCTFVNHPEALRRQLSWPVPIPISQSQARTFAFRNREVPSAIEDN